MNYGLVDARPRPQGAHRSIDPTWSASCTPVSIHARRCTRCSPISPARGGRVALRVIGGGRAAVSCAELDRAARAHAACMRAGGIRAGDRVAVWATPELATIAAIVGNALAGIATVPLNPSLGEGELAHVLGDAAPRLVLAADPAAFHARTPQTRAIALDGPTAVAGRARARRSAARALHLRHDRPAEGRRHHPPQRRLRPRRARRRMGLDGAGRARARAAALPRPRARPRRPRLAAGSAPRCALLPRFTPDGVCAAMDGGGTMLFARADHVPPARGALRGGARETRAGSRRARLLVSGSAALPVRENERLFRLFGQRVVERYGLTETLIDHRRAPRRAAHAGRRRPPAPRASTLRLVDEAAPPDRAGAGRARGGGGEGARPCSPAT